MSIPAARLTQDGAYRMAPDHVAIDCDFRSLDTYGAPLTHGTRTAGGGGVSNGTEPRGAVLSVGSTSGDVAAISTLAAYRHGRSAHRLAHSTSGAANQVRRWGRFDADSGVFFALVGTVLSLVTRRLVSGNATDTAIASIAWNEDRADGTGDLAALDIDRPHVYEIETPPAGVGPTRCFVDGVLVHTFDGTEQNYFDSSILPGRVEVENTGTAATAAITLQHERIVTYEADDWQPGIGTQSIGPDDFTGGRILIGVTPAKFGGDTNRTNRTRIKPGALRIDSNADGIATVSVRSGVTISGETGRRASGVQHYTLDGDDGTTIDPGFSFAFKANTPIEVDLESRIREICMIDFSDGDLSDDDTSRPSIVVSAVSGASATIRASLSWGST